MKLLVSVSSLLFCYSWPAFMPLVAAQEAGQETPCGLLTRAIGMGDVASLQALLNSDLDPNQTCQAASYLIDDEPVALTPLIMAVEKGHLDMVKALLAASADLEKMTLVRPARAETFFLKRFRPGPVGNARLLELYEFGYTPLLAAMLTNHLEIFKYLLAQGAKPDAVYDTMTVFHPFNAPSHEKQSQIEYVPLYIAKYLSDKEMVITLLEYGADPYRQLSGQHFMPIDEHHALNFIMLAGATTDDIARVLKLNIDVNAVSKEDDLKFGPPTTPLKIAVARENIEMLKFLLKNGAKLDLKKLYQGRYYDVQLLYFAAAGNDRPEMIRFLRALGVKPHGRGRFYRSPIMNAMYSPEVLAEILDLGYDPNNTNGRGKSCLHIAASYEEIELQALEMLIKAGADVNRQWSPMSQGDPFEDEGRLTPLMLALHDRDTELYEVVKILLENGARTDLKTGEGRTALDIWQDREKYFSRQNEMEAFKITTSLAAQYKKDKRKAALERLVWWLFWIACLWVLFELIKRQRARRRAIQRPERGLA